MVAVFEKSVHVVYVGETPYERPPDAGYGSWYGYTHRQDVLDLPYLFIYQVERDKIEWR